MADFKVGTRFTVTEKGLEQICVDCFGPVEEYWDCEDMLHERKYNTWKATGVYTRDDTRYYTLQRLLPDNVKPAIEDFLDDVEGEYLATDHFEIAD